MNDCQLGMRLEEGVGMKSNTEIANSIKEILRNVCAENSRNGISSDKGWTNCIFGKLAELCQIWEFKCCCSRVPHTEPEWLFDMLWYKYDASNRLASIPFILECEWSRNKVDVKYDFEKLLVAKADIKLLITQIDFKCDFEEGIKTFPKKDQNEMYLLACWQDGSPSIFNVHQYNGMGEPIN